MGILSSVIGGAVNLIGGIAGGIASSKAAKQADKLIAQQKAKNEAWYEKNYNANYTQRADAQELLQNTRDYLDKKYGQSAATNTVMGGTDEALALEKANANQTLADSVAAINANADNYKSGIENAYMNADMNLTQQQVQNQQIKAQNIANAASQASAGAAGIVGSIFDKKPV
jgi:hypothetical protein